MVFVVDKSLIIIIFMYSVSIVVLTGQYMIADVFNFTLVSPVTGAPMTSAIISDVNPNQIQSFENNATSTARPALFNCFGLQICTQLEFWGNLFFNIWTIMTGSKIWDILIFFGIPGIFVLAILTPYYILLFRTFIGYAKNFF